MKLIVAEKPSVARDIARVLKISGRGQGFIGTGDVRVSWCVGHLAQLSEPASYNPEWRAWRLDLLPMLPTAFTLEPRKSAQDQWRILRDLLRDSALDEVVNACDAGREGELIFAYAYELAGCKAGVRRLWISSMTDSAIQHGFDTLRPGVDMANLESAARCRSEADWLVGLNATRAMTSKYRSGRGGTLLSVGRVQTPTLALLAQREDEIEGFVPRDFQQIKAVFVAEEKEGRPRGTYDATWTRKGKRGEDADRFYDKAAAQEVLDRVSGRAGLVTTVDKKKKVERPPFLYDLTTLQKEANKRFGYSAKKTLDLAQALYETHKLLTYPRTDSRHLSKDQEPTLPGVLSGVAFGPYQVAAQATLDRWPVKLSKRVVDDAEVSDHHAIIPTGEDARGARLTVEEKRIFDLVTRRFLAVFCADAVFATVQVKTVIDQDLFLSRGRTCLEQGWRTIDPPASGKKQKQEILLPAVVVDETVEQASCQLHEGQTKPPKRFTEGTLLAAMERAGEAIKDAELKRAMKRNGLGTPATRASIIETLISRRFVERQAKNLAATEAGRTLVAAIPVEELRSPRLTGAWEARLVAMAEGTETRERFMEDIRAFTTQLIDSVRGAQIDEAVKAKLAPPPPDGKVLGACPVCGQEVRAADRGWGCVDCDLHIPGLVASREVSAQLAKQLLADGETKVVKGFKSRAGKAFSAALAFDGEGGVKLQFPDPEALGDCPLCKKPVRRRGKIVTCDTGRECRFVVFEEMGGLQPTDDDVRALLAGRPSRLEWAGDRLIAREKDERELCGDVGACPRCGCGVFFNGKKWGCRGCGFRLPQALGGRQFAPLEILELLKNGRTSRLHGFRQKTGAVFKAAVVLEPDNHLSWDFHKPDGAEDDGHIDCPICIHNAESHPGRVIAGRTAWGCTRWKAGCGLRVPFDIEGVRLSEDQLQRLMSKYKATRYLKGFAGRKRTARVALDPAAPAPHWSVQERGQ